MARSSRPVAPESSHSRILVVDDDADLVTLVCAMLAQDYVVRSLDSFSRVGDEARAFQPDLILLDWNLPGVSGIDLCAELAEDPDLAGVPILFMTAHTSIADETRGLQAGAADYIRKPISPELLKARIRNHLVVRHHLAGARHQLAVTATAHQRIAESKAAITQLLETALEPMTLQAQLESALGIINSIPWLEVEFQGAVFLADDEGVLTLAASRGMDPRLQTLCARVEPGLCLCGRAARERCLVFADHVDDRHDIYDNGGCDHGHYALPLLERDRLLGVLTIYVRKGHRPVTGEFAFMEEVAKVVSGLISRRLMESILEIRKFEVQESQTEVIRVLGLAAEYRDNETGLHVVRVAHFARLIAAAAGLPPEDVDLLFQAVPMHDIGKIGVPDTILRKPGRLTEAEFTVMRTHTTIGEQILTGDNPVMVVARSIAGSHHERWDGTGYPRGLQEDAIPVLGRVCALADVFDALSQARPYKKAWPTDDILAYIRQSSGTQFDPLLVDAFFRVVPSILRLRTLYSDDLIDPRKQAFLDPVAGGDDSAFAWRDGYAVGIGVIDEHHRYLLDLMNALHGALNAEGNVLEIARALKALESYTVVHFAEEERLMDAFGYAERQAHAREHATFVAQIGRMWVVLRSNPLLSGHGTLGFLRDWLINHIQVSDVRMAAAILATADGLPPARQ